MSQREVDRLEVVQQVADRQLGQARAAERLAVSVRQVKRLVRAYRRAGAAGLVSQRRGQPSNRRIAAEQEHFVELVRRHYSDFGPTLAAQHLAAEHDLLYSAETCATG
jgi:transposase